MSATAVLQVRGLKKHFPVTRGFIWKKVVGWVQAVDGIDFSIPEGETLAIVGESGCGKTTTAKLVLRLEEPTEGHVFADGRDVHALEGEALKDYRTTVQAVFQDPWSSLNPRMRVRDIVAEPLVCNQQVSDQEVKDRVGEALASVGLRPQQASLYPHEFSGGQRQRIAVASALVSKPKLKIVEKAKTKELFDNPLHPYTKALFSAALPAHPDITREEIILTGEVPSPINPPSGCRFHPRCPFAMPQCAQIAPVEKEVAPDHMVACHLY